jgi:AhpD family alkylhydroperoxidase
MCASGVTGCGECVLVHYEEEDVKVHGGSPMHWYTTR